MVDISPLLDSNCKKVEFKSDWQGNWELIPAEASSHFSDLDVAVKFGMNLLLNPDSVPTRLGILSYHHGDPTKYRGRPAVFHEMLNGEKTVGAMVQRLNNTLDGGVVLAQCMAPITEYSYRDTLINTYLASVPLLHKSATTLQFIEEFSSPTSLGTLRTLPRNWEVFRLSINILRSKLRHLIYGLFVEKVWQLGQLPKFAHGNKVLGIEVSDLQIIRAPQGYSFVADPFVFKSTIYCEGMDARTGVGKILRYDGTWFEMNLGLDEQHVSYPQIISDGSRTYLLPEVGGHLSPQLYELTPDGKVVVSISPLLGFDGVRLTDATLFEQNGEWFLFGSQGPTSDYQLELWVGEAIYGPYHQHPSSPIRIDPTGSRMAGPVDSKNGTVLRFGQDCASRYGDGVNIFKITNLTSTEYEEIPFGEIHMTGAFGPHTFSRNGQGVILDFYKERITLMAGVRRIRAYLYLRKGKRQCNINVTTKDT